MKQFIPGKLYRCGDADKVPTYNPRAVLPDGRSGRSTVYPADTSVFMYLEKDYQRYKAHPTLYFLAPNGRKVCFDEGSYNAERLVPAK